jgi:hypothetical protein
MLKYGKLALFDGLSGSSGQVASPHGVPELAGETPGIELPAVIDAPALPATRRRRRAAAPDPATKGPAILS